MLALFRDCILRGSENASLATARHLFEFVNAVFPDAVSEPELEALLQYYLSRDLTCDKLAFGVFVERMLRPASSDFSGMLDLNLGSYTASEYLPAPRSAEVALATLILKLTLNMQRNKRIRETLKALTKGQVDIALRYIKGPFSQTCTFDQFTHYIASRMPFSEKEEEYLRRRFAGRDGTVNEEDFVEQLVKWV